MSPDDEAGYWVVCLYMVAIVSTSYAILGKLSAAVRPGGSIEAALQKTFDVETMKAIDRNNDGEVEKHECVPPPPPTSPPVCFMWAFCGGCCQHSQ